MSCPDLSSVDQLLPEFQYNLELFWETLFNLLFFNKMVASWGVTWQIAVDPLTIYY